ncbi:MAG: hypothetical protein ABJN26_00065 [Stappiaceae bacterium]
MIGFLLMAAKWLFQSNGGRILTAVTLAVAVLCGIWIHGYHTSKNTSKTDRLRASIQKQRDRIEIDDDIQASGDRDLCRRLGGGVQCDRF